MDPSQVQADPTNDSHSLEQVDEKAADKSSASEAASKDTKNDDKKDGIIDTTSGASDDDKSPKSKKKNPLKAFWQKFNLYLALFILVVVVAVGILVTLTIKSNKPPKNALDSQNLSQQELQQLANTDVTVGSPKQVLTVQANAVFAGAVLVRSNLEVAGSLKVGGSLSLNSLTVTGATQLSDTNVGNLTVTGALNVQGALALKNGISVSGNSNFTGNVTTASLTTGTLNLNGDLVLTHHISAGGPTPGISRGTATGGGGTVSLSGSDTSGSITINTGSNPPAGCFASVTFSTKFANTPHVVVTPIGSGAAGLQYYIDRTTSGFSICAANAATAGMSFGFDYMTLD
jgi:cytoskeletal protein CcmA (bactofilin family)